MSNLRVNGKTLHFKGVNYQISQIASHKVVHVEKEIEVDYTSLKPLKALIPVALVTLFQFFLGLGSWFALLVFLGSAGSAVYLIKSRIEENSLPTKKNLYGLTLRMSNGDYPIFVSSSKKLILEVNDAVEAAMNNTDGMSVNLENVNIDITDTEDVNIGSVVSS